MIIWIAFTAAVYVPAAGLGFVKDDFAWVTAATQAAAQPLSVFTRDASGTFYRPLVTLSFAADYTLYGLSSRGYGVTNLLLYAACALAIGALFRGLGRRDDERSDWRVCLGKQSARHQHVAPLAERTDVVAHDPVLLPSVLAFLGRRRTGGAVC